MKRIASALAVLIVLGGLLFAAAPAQASTHPARWYALKWAEGQAGAWYCWGGTGGCFDCSGLVYEAYLHQGVNIGRDTYAMLANVHLRRIPIADAVQGDLMFFGTGHVELKTRWWHGTFGALESGTQVGWHTWGGWWAPTMAFRVVA